MDRYQCLEWFYSHGGHLLLPPVMGGITGVSNSPHDAPSDAKVSFFDNLLKKLDSGSSSQKKIFGFLYLSLKLSLTLPIKGKML